MNAEVRREATRLYRYLRKSTLLQHYDRDRFLQLLGSLPPHRQVENLRITLLHLQTRDQLSHLMQEYRIGIKRDEKEMIRKVARYVGLEITRNESNN